LYSLIRKTYITTHTYCTRSTGNNRQEPAQQFCQSAFHENKYKGGTEKVLKIFTTAIIKGGTGKSTTAAALAQVAHKSGKKALAIDLDPQANLSFFIGADQNAPGVYDLLHGSAVADVIQTTPQHIDVITASPDLATEKTTAGSVKRLQEALEPVKDKYSFCFIDTPPQMGELTYNALQAADGLIIPLETDNSSIQGLYQISDIASQMQDSNPQLSIIGVVLTRYDSRPKLNRYLQSEIEKTAGEIGAPYLGAIRSGIAIREAQAMQQNLYDYAPRSNPAVDYRNLYAKITAAV
jgi:chromosome partitioning protein